MPKNISFAAKYLIKNYGHHKDVATRIKDAIGTGKPFVTDDNTTTITTSSNNNSSTMSQKSRDRLHRAYIKAINLLAKS